MTPKQSPTPTRPRNPLRLERLEERDVPAVYSVTSAADTGPNTLRDAIQQSNASAGVPDTIVFNLAAGSRTISPASALPTVTDPVVIDGTSQSGYSGSPLIELSGAGAGGADGLTITAGNSTVRGLSVTGFAAVSPTSTPSGIRLGGSGGNVVEGNWIGLRPDGTALGNGNGVWLLSSGNRVGGAMPAARNVISGNTDGVRVGDVGALANGNELLGNYIGTDPTGTSVSAGLTLLGNAFTGILLVGANNTVIGRPGAGNVISGGHSDGAIDVIGSANGNVIQANFIGLAADGATVLGTSGPGVVFGTATSNALNSTLVANLVGGTGTGQGNRIAGSTYGVFIAADVPTGGFGNVFLSRGISVLGNSIFGTSRSGIGLGTSGAPGVAAGTVPPNDAGDGDTGANGLQNCPVITSVTPGASSTTVAGTFNSQPNTTYRLEFFSNPATSGTGTREGRTFLGAISVTTNGTGDAPFNAVLSAVVTVGQPITATATAPDGSTSPFSLPSHGLIVTQPAVALGPTQFGTSEAGGTQTFTIALASQPTADVTVTPVSSDTTEGTVGGPLTFTASNWSTPQTVTVTGADDDLADGTVFYSVSVGTASADPRYSGISALVLSTSNTDNESIVAQGFVQTSEAGVLGAFGANNTFTVALGRAPGANVTVSFTGLDPTEHALSANTLTFTPANWNVAQTVTVTGLDDALVDGSVSYPLTPVGASTDPIFNGLVGIPVFLTNQDDDLIVLSASALTLTEGGTTTFTVQLAQAPTQPVTIPSLFASGLSVSFAPQPLTFTAANWNVPRTVTVTSARDFFARGPQTAQVVLTSTSGTSTSVKPLAVTVADIDPGIVGQVEGLPVFSPGTTTEAGGTARVLVSLSTQPAANVTVPVASSNAAEGQTDVTSLTFTPANWNVAQVVTVTGQNDALSDGDIAYTLTLGSSSSTDAVYNNKFASIGLTNRDNEPGVRYSQTSFLTTSEANTFSPITFTVALTTQPTANVTVPLSSSDPTEGTVSPSALTFTSANWNVPQTVSVQGVDDALVDGNIAYAVVVGALQSSDPAYNGLNPADVQLTNFDNDGPAPAIVVSALSGQTTEAGGTFTFGVSLATAPSGFGSPTVTVPVASSNPAEGTVSVSSLTFTTANWNVPQTVTVTGVPDAAPDGNVYYSVLLGPATSSDFSYSGKRGPDVVVLNTNTNAGILVAPGAVSTTEAGGTATFTVVLASQPTAAVTIPVGSSDLTEGTVSVSALTFTASNWNVPQTVTVTGVDDAIIDGNVSYTVTLGSATSADPAYNGINAADVQVTNVDNDTPTPPAAVSVTPTVLTTTEAGGTATFTVVLATVPTATVTIALTVTAPTEGTISTGTLTFTPANALVPQTVTVTGVDDTIIDGAVGYTVVTTATSTDPAYNNIAVADVAVTNTDNDTAPVPPAPAPTPPVLPIAPPVLTGGGPGQFVIRDPQTGAVAGSVVPFAGYAGQLVMATGDVSGDGEADYLVGTTAGTSAHLKVIDGATGKELFSILPFGAGFLGGLSVAAADLNGDGRADLIVGVGPGAPGGHVKVFDGATGAELRSFLSFEGFTGGVSVAAGDVNGDGSIDLLVGTASGASHLKVFDGTTGQELFSRFPFGAGYSGGLQVAAIDLDGDGAAELVVGSARGPSHVKAFDGRTGAEVLSFLAFTDPAANGARPTGVGAGGAKLLVFTADGRSRTFDGSGNELTDLLR